MKQLFQYRWILMVVWIVMLAASALLKPDIDTLIRDKGQPRIPDSYSSVQASEILNRIGQTPAGVKPMDLVVVFHEAEKLSAEQFAQIRAEIADLQHSSGDLDIVRFTDPFATPLLQSQLVSRDGTTVMVPLSFDKAVITVSEATDGLRQALQNSPVKTYITGNERIMEDQILTSQAGVKKTEIITVAFIILILILIFRSPVTPVLSLLIVGVTYVISLGAVTNMVDLWNFPFATTTQTFLLLVLFGIGTDYLILLLSRLKEEMANGLAIREAIAATYRTAGRTVLFSGAAVFIGFSILGFAKFSVYQSAVAVAVGIAVLLLVLFTLLPVCMLWTHRFLFWPVKIGRSRSHGADSRIWQRIGSFSLSRPLVSLLLVGVLTIPLLASYRGQLSFDSTREVSKSYSSIQGLAILSDAYTAGKAMPSTVVIETEERLDTRERLAAIERLTSELAALQGVQQVYGPTRPTGEAMNGLASADAKQVQAVLDAYMSPDRQSFKLSVELAVDPYSADAMDVIGYVREEAVKQLAAAGIHSYKMGLGGVSSVNRDLRQIADEDFQRSVYLMLIGIFLILLYMMRTFWIPLYILASLALSYFTALSLTEIVAAKLFGVVGLSWMAPFFSFIMITALGVDYSIFLMMRYKEYAGRPPADAMLQALKRIGSVVISAAVILSGTFAALYPAGVPSLMQIATIVIIGLVLLTLLMLPAFIPSLMAVQAGLTRSPGRAGRRSKI